MKKLCSLLLVLCLMFSLSACGNDKSTQESNNSGFCVECGGEISSTDKFCGSCGANVNKPDSADANDDATTKPTTQIHTHSYSDATCTEPAKCSCGQIDGDALGHSFNNGSCTRCGFVKFETLKFSGSNQGIVAENINLPKGQYRVLISFESTDAYMLENYSGGWLNVHLNGDSYGESFSSVDSGSAKATIIDGPVSNGYILIDGHEGNWKITIEAFN